ncbi:hypothetical protein JCM33374_g5213 [Metschnikowia sp. JCM 33374]|nr:hypothetical protein JCM33374_g5213 [Metschnikowia sp. JCM 33374]
MHDDISDRDVSLVYSCFVDHAREFVVFSEARHETFDRSQGSAQEKEGLVSKKLEKHSSLSAEPIDEKEVWTKKAKKFLENNLACIDKPTALLVSHMYESKISEVFVRAKAENSEENSFRSAQMAGDFSPALEI